MHSSLALSMGNNYPHVEEGKKLIFLKTLQMDAKFLRKLGYNQCRYIRQQELVQWSRE